MTTAARRTRFTTPNGTDIVAVRTFGAPRRTVWSAFTEPEHVQRWLALPHSPMQLCEIDLRVGGAYRYRWGLPDGESFGFHGEYLEVQAPARLVSTEVYEPAPSQVPTSGEWTADTAAVNTLSLAEADGRTTITMLMHYPSQEVRDAVLATGMADGFDATLSQLEQLLAEG